MDKKKGLLMLLCAVCALAAPELGGVFASDSGLVIGSGGWSFDFTASEGGRLAMELLSGETGEVIASLGAADIQAGAGRLAWDGLLPDGTPAPAGSCMIAVQLRNYWGEESERALLSVHLSEALH